MYVPMQRNWHRYLYLAVLSIIGICFVLFAGLAVLSLLAFSTNGSRGPLEDRTQWPEPIQNLLAKAFREHIDVEPVAMYRTVDFTEKVYCWRMKSSPELIDLMTREWKLKPGTPAEVENFWGEWPHGWENGAKQNGQRLLGNYAKPSDNFIVIASDSQPVVYGYYYFNF